MPSSVGPGRAARKRLAENVCLLFAINAGPAGAMLDEPWNFPKPSLSANDTTRLLSFDHEERLANDLAFLSATVYDPERVMAVALEEDNDHQGLTIRFASNSGDLSELCSGMSALTTILEKVAQGGTCVSQPSDYIRVR